MKKIFEDKSIILAITPDVALYKCFVDNLEYLGFTVFLICNTEKFEYENIFQRLTNTVRKTLFNDTFFKRECKRQFYKEKNLAKLNQIKNADYSLTIRADMFDKSVIKEITKKAKRNIAYQWDGLNRFPEVKDLISLFDKFYVFDKNDLNQSFKVNFTTNFYFDCYFSDLLKTASKTEFDVYFIGSYDSRINKLIAICDHLQHNNLKLNIILCGSPVKKLQKHAYITFIKERLNNFENLKMISNSKIIIDLHYDTLHTGLSFRIFDALGNRKKIISTNKNLMQYDFYNKNNIYILDYSEISIETFMESPFDDSNYDVIQNYSFTKWITKMLHTEDDEKF
jgi:hypothetical protein